MRDMGQNFNALLAREDLALVYLFELTLKDTSVYRYTDAVTSIYAEGFRWFAQPGIDISAIRDTQDAQSQTATVEVAYADNMLTEEIARKGGLDGATFRILCVDWRAPQMGSFEVFSGHVDKLTASNKFFCSIDLTGWQVRSVQITGVYSMKCRNVFCDKGCALQIENYSYPFTVEGDSDGDGVGSSELQAIPEAELANGSILWTSGRNTGEVTLIAYNDTYLCAFRQNPPYKPRNGDTGIARAGCDYYADTCEKRYNNLVHFQGEPAVPVGTATGNGASTTVVVADPVKPPPDTVTPVQAVSYRAQYPRAANG